MQKAAVKVATNPVGTVLGIPTGIKHLPSGYEATASDAKAQVQKTLAGGAAESSGSAASRATSPAK